MPQENLSQQSPVLIPFDVTPEVLQYFQGTGIDKGANRDAFIANVGHQVLESYSEKATLTAVWRLHLPSPKNKPEDIYALRMTLQKYFLGPRTVAEVCGFLSTPKESFQDINVIPDIKVSIFGYRDEFTMQPVDLNNEAPSYASHYLTQDALLRNKKRVAITMRPWQGLYVTGFTPPDNTVAKDIPPVAPEEFYILNVQKAERLLLLLEIYSLNYPESGVDPKNLPQFGKTLDKILDPSSIAPDTGKMLPQKKEWLTQLVRDLEKALPASDPESPPEEDTATEEESD